MPAQLKCEDLCCLSSHQSLDCLTVFIINSKNFKGREEGRGEGGRREGREGREGGKERGRKEMKAPQAKTMLTAARRWLGFYG